MTQKIIPTMDIKLEATADLPVSVLRKAAPCLSSVELYGAEINERGEILADAPVSLSAAAREEGVQPLLAVSNSNALPTHELLSDSAVFERFSGSLLSVLQKHGFAGVCFAFSLLPPFERDNYTRFLRDIAAQLHAAGLTVGCVCPSPFCPASAPAYDLTALAAFLDELTLPVRALPATTEDALQDALHSALNAVRPEKLWAGLTYEAGLWHFPHSAGDAPENISVESAAALARIHKAGISHSPAPHCFFRDAAGKECELWLEDAEHFEKLLALVDKAGLAGISLRIGRRFEEPLFELLGRRYHVLKRI